MRLIGLPLVLITLGLSAGSTACRTFGFGTTTGDSRSANTATTGAPGGQGGAPAAGAGAGPGGAASSAPGGQAAQVSPAGPAGYVGVGLPPLANQITIDVQSVLRSLTPQPYGMNLIYLRDDDRNRGAGARTLSAAIHDLGAHFLRYPGGEKANFSMWSQAPWTAPNPKVYGNIYPSIADKYLLDFDAYMQLVHDTGAEPYVVVGYSTSSGISESDYITAAAQMVNYANVVKKWGITYWEIGNENYLASKNPNPESVGRVVSRYSQAMKAVDPTIKIGASGQADDWWRRMLGVCANDLDFLTYSNYTQPSSYANYVAKGTDALANFQPVLQAIDRYTTSPARERLKVIAAEFNPIDWQKNWPNSNDLAHSMIAFDMLGAIISEPRVLAAMFWTTRWTRDQDFSPDGFYALDGNNNPTPIGQALGLWGRFSQGQLLQPQGSLDQVTIWATSSPDTQRTTIFLVNKAGAARTANLAVQHLTFQAGSVAPWVYSGTAPSDAKPVLMQAAAVPWPDNRAAVTLPPYSISVFDLQAPAP